MFLTLRKAHAIIKQLERGTNQSEATVAVSHESTEEDVLAAIGTVSAQNTAVITLSLATSELHFRLRRAIQVANQTTSGDKSVDSLLNDKASTEKVLNILKPFSGITEFTEDEVRAKEIINSAKREEKSYGRSMTSVGGYSKLQKNNLREQYYDAKRTLETIVEQLSVLNNSIKIEISTPEEELLKILRIL